MRGYQNPPAKTKANATATATGQAPKAVAYPAIVRQADWLDPHAALRLTQQTGVPTLVICTKSDVPESQRLRLALGILGREAQGMGVQLTELTDETHGRLLTQLGVKQYPTVILYGRNPADPKGVTLLATKQGPTLDAADVFAWLQGLRTAAVRQNPSISIPMTPGNPTPIGFPNDPSIQQTGIPVDPPATPSAQQPPAVRPAPQSVEPPPTLTFPGSQSGALSSPPPATPNPALMPTPQAPGKAGLPPQGLPLGNTAYPNLQAPRKTLMPNMSASVPTPAPMPMPIPIPLPLSAPAEPIQPFSDIPTSSTPPAPSKSEPVATPPFVAQPASPLTSSDEARIKAEVLSWLEARTQAQNQALAQAQSLINAQSQALEQARKNAEVSAAKFASTLNAIQVAPSPQNAITPAVETPIALTPPLTEPATPYSQFLTPPGKTPPKAIETKSLPIAAKSLPASVPPALRGMIPTQGYTTSALQMPGMPYMLVIQVPSAPCPTAPPIHCLCPPSKSGYATTNMGDAPLMLAPLAVGDKSPARTLPVPGKSSPTLTPGEPTAMSQLFLSPGEPSGPEPSPQTQTPPFTEFRAQPVPSPQATMTWMPLPQVLPSAQSETAMAASRSRRYADGENRLERFLSDLSRRLKSKPKYALSLHGLPPGDFQYLPIGSAQNILPSEQSEANLLHSGVIVMPGNAGAVYPVSANPQNPPGYNPTSAASITPTPQSQGIIP